MIIKTDDSKKVAFYVENYGECVLTRSQLKEEALDDMNNSYIDILGSSILGSELGNYLKPEAYEKLTEDHILNYADQNYNLVEISAYELLAEVIKVLSPKEVEKFARSARS